MEADDGLSGAGLPTDAPVYTDEKDIRIQWLEGALAHMTDSRDIAQMTIDKVRAQLDAAGVPVFANYPPQRIEALIAQRDAAVAEMIRACASCHYGGKPCSHHAPFVASGESVAA